MFKYAVVAESEKIAQDFLQRREVDYDWFTSLISLQRYHVIFVVEFQIPSRTVDTVRQLKALGIPLVVVVGAARSSVSIYDLFEAGSDEYISFDASKVEFTARLLGVRKRLGLLDIIFCGNLELRQKERMLIYQGREYLLSEKEFQLLRLLVLNANEIVTRKEISRIVWRRDYDPSTNIIEVYVNMLRKKVFGSISQNLLRTVGGQGYSLVI